MVGCKGSLSSEDNTPATRTTSLGVVGLNYRHQTIASLFITLEFAPSAWRGGWKMAASQKPNKCMHAYSAGAIDSRMVRCCPQNCTLASVRAQVPSATCARQYQAAACTCALEHETWITHLEVTNGINSHRVDTPWTKKHPEAL